jgi:outer membrane autotransporter protein
MPGSFDAAAQTRNQRALAHALDAAAPGADGALHDVIGNLSLVDAPTARAGFNILSGEGYAAFADTGLQANRDFVSLLRGAAAQTSGRDGALAGFDAPRQSMSADAGKGDPSIWLTAIGGFGHTDGSSGTSRVHASSTGMAGGFDLSPAPHWSIGGAFGYVHSSLGVRGKGSGKLETWQGALYGGYSGSRGYVTIAAGYARSTGDLHRSLAPAAPFSATGHIRANQYFASGEAGLDLARWNGAVLTSFLGVDAARYDQAALAEKQAAAVGLAMRAQRTDSLQSVLGMQLSTEHLTGHGSPLNASLRLGWGHEFADVDRPVTAAFIGAPDVPFTVRGAPAARNFGAVGVRLGADLQRGLSIAARYDAMLSGRSSQQSISLSARLAW